MSLATIATTALAQQNLGNLESFVGQDQAYEDAGFLTFGEYGSGEYGSYNDATVSSILTVNRLLICLWLTSKQLVF